MMLYYIILYAMDFGVHEFLFLEKWGKKGYHSCWIYELI